MREGIEEQFDAFSDWILWALAGLLVLSMGIVLGIVIEKLSQKFIIPNNNKSTQQQTKGFASTINNTTAMNSSTSIQTIPYDPAKSPKHIAVIMDGNRRFGRQINADPLQGHWAGGQRLVDFVQWCMQEHIYILTVYAFSSENWNRDASEVTTLMTIFAKYAETFRTEALAKNIRVNVYSTEFHKLPPKVQLSVQELMASTKHCTKFVLNICLSYGSRQEILQACQHIGQDLLNSSIQLQEINETLFQRYLQTHDYPDPDILIRTSGEFRISNFLLWQIAYTELFFLDKLWPEVTQGDLQHILAQYAARHRRFGT